MSALTFVLAGLARLAVTRPGLDDGLRERLDALHRRFAANRAALLRGFADYARAPRDADAPLLALARRFRLSASETLAVCLAAACEDDVVTGHLVAQLQEPLAQTRPTVGLLAQAYGDEGCASAVHAVAQGAAVACGLLQISGDDAPLPDRHVRIPLPTSVALRGMPSAWPGTSPLRTPHAVALGAGARAHAATLAARLRGDDAPALVVRGGNDAEARAAAEHVARALERRTVLVRGDELAGMAPWLELSGAIPVFARWPAPGERHAIPDIPAFTGPVIVTSGPDGDFESDARAVIEWRLEVPPPEQRAALWTALLGDAALAGRIAAEHRQTAGRIAALGAAVREAAAPGTAPTYDDVRAAARRGEATGLSALAETIADEVDDAALVVPGELRDELESLVVRCRVRERFCDGLGPSIRARYRPSVRALFVGQSGTGKTLAAAWLATRLGIPLFRVDLSAITSKYIGETEKNLSRLLTLAEHSEVVLLFDEADALFGKRTDIHDANDRFANAQTNYLLQRMESYDGITVLTSNGRGRFDAAFARRFDAIVTFPAPGAQERRALWIAHLGDAHDLAPAQLNVLAAVAELSGGQIRNAVLRAAVDAARDRTAIRFAHVRSGVESEYRKISRQIPSELRADGGSVTA
ncbi:MAG TPA: ATP-binding protein [Candidatus Elarobacter sp.]|nr:ATP-binding protein [Candidatus Elarobacter sp.]